VRLRYRRDQGRYWPVQEGDELVVEVGTLRRHIACPLDGHAGTRPSAARKSDLTVEMKEAQ